MPSVAGNTQFNVGDNFTALKANAYPRGCFSYAVNTASINLTTSPVLMMSITWTAESTRIYKITYFEPQILLPTSPATVDMTIRVDNAAGAQVAQSRISSPTTTTDLFCSVILTGLSGLKTYAGCLVASSTTGTPSATRGATQNALMFIEDIGGT
jgi:hypothetical protein